MCLGDPGASGTADSKYKELLEEFQYKEEKKSRIGKKHSFHNSALFLLFLLLMVLQFQMEEISMLVA